MAPKSRRSTDSKCFSMSHWDFAGPEHRAMCEMVEKSSKVEGNVISTKCASVHVKMCMRCNHKVDKDPFKIAGNKCPPINCNHVCSVQPMTTSKATSDLCAQKKNDDRVAQGRTNPGCLVNDSTAHARDLEIAHQCTIPRGGPIDWDDNDPKPAPP